MQNTVCFEIFNQKVAYVHGLFVAFLFLPLKFPSHAGKLLIHIGPTFFVEKLLCEYSSDSLQIWNSKRSFMANVSIVLDFLFFAFLAGK